MKMPIALLLCALLLPAAVVAQTPDYPAPVKALMAKGMKVQGTFPAPAGFKGYVLEAHGRKLPLYVLPDGKHSVIGAIYDAHGKDLTRGPFGDASAPTLGPKDWQALKQSTWIAEGAKKPDRVVYAFTDTECPHCHDLWKKLQPRLKRNKVQVRYVLVAIINRDSIGRAVAMLHADDPSAALQRHENHFDNSPIKPLAQVPPDQGRRIVDNIRLMNRLGSHQTPTLVYRDAKGKVRMHKGVPDAALLKRLFRP